MHHVILNMDGMEWKETGYMGNCNCHEAFREVHK